MEFEYVGTTLTIKGSGTVTKFEEYKDATKIIVSDTFTRIDDEVFCYRTSLVELILPDSITYVGNHLVAQTKLTKLHIPLSLSSISDMQPFDQCSTLEEFTIDPNHEYYKVIDGILFSRDMKKIICYPGGKQGTTYSIPQGIIEHFTSAIGLNPYLKNVIIPASLIKSHCFGYNNPLYNVTIFRCNGTNSQDNVYNNSGFFYCMDQKNLRLTYKFTSYEYSLSSDEKVLTVMPIKGCRYAGKQRINFDDVSFQGNDKLEEVIFKEGITSYDANCFKGCNNLNKIRFVKNYNKICTKSSKQNQANNFIYFIISLIIR